MAMVLFDFPMVLQCVRLILIVVSYSVACFSFGFVIFLIDLKRRPSPDLRSFYDFLVMLWFCCGLLYILLILIVGPRPIFGYLIISSGLICFAMFSIYLNGRPSPNF